MLSTHLPLGTLPRRSRGANAFTLVEVLVATILLALVAASIIWGLSMLHQRSTANRLYTQAQTICQNRIDKILTVGPYNPSSTPAAVPPELQSNQADQTVAISTEPTNPVNGTMKTIVSTDTTLKYPASTGTVLNIKQAKVVVEYWFRGKKYSIEMNTLRAPDQ